jgi:hypothetical protein
LFIDSYFSKYSITWHRNHGLEGLAVLLQIEPTYLLSPSSQKKENNEENYLPLSAWYILSKYSEVPQKGDCDFCCHVVNK